jgi:uncharacterized membrane protein YeiB
MQPMTVTSLTESPGALAPVAGSERIQALDVVRGFALIGIFLMNIEFFNRPLSELGSGLPANLHGADYAAGWFIYSFVQGKFWTMFSLLFGMGFAVMLTRAERAGRSFLVPYVRRIAALALFGALHHVFLWGGDILFSYAVGASCLLLLLWARWLPLVLGMLAIFATGFLPGFDWMFQVVGGLVFVLLGSLFLRAEGRVPGTPLPWLSLAFLVLGAVALVLAVVAGLGPVPAEARWPFAIGAFFLSLLGVLSWRFKDPADARPRRLGASMYLVPFCVILSFGLLQLFGPARPKATEAQVVAAMAEVRAERAAEKAGANAAPAAKPGDAKVAGAKTGAAKAAKAEPTAVEKAARREAQQRLGREEQEAESAAERKLLTTGSYADLVRLRAGQFIEHAPGEFGFSTLIIGMFLLGYWFVRSGIMENTGAHLDLFRRIAIIGVPVGVGLGLLGGMLATHPTPGLDRDPYQASIALAMLGNLPACLGYVSLIVLMLHSDSVLARIRVLAPLGRMALTNYLTHSLVSSLYFYHYGLGHYGMPRAQQVGFVFLVIALQVVFCHWWLSKFRYGPMEWLWRAITYWTLPPMRREPAPLASAAAA